MDFSFDDPTGDYSNFAAALKAAKEAFPSDGEYEDSDYDSDDSDDGKLLMLGSLLFAWESRPSANLHTRSMTPLLTSQLTD